MSALLLYTLQTSLTEDAARVSRVALEKGGSGPAAARVESARSTMERRMVVFVGVFGCAMIMSVRIIRPAEEGSYGERRV